MYTIEVRQIDDWHGFIQWAETHKDLAEIVFEETLVPGSQFGHTEKLPTHINLKDSATVDFCILKFGA